MPFIAAYLSILVAVTAIDFFWTVILFDSHYQRAIGEILRDGPFLMVAASGNALISAAVLTFFFWLYPRGTFRPALGFGMALLFWIPNLTASIVTAAKLNVTLIAAFLGLETGLTLLNAAVIGIILTVFFANLPERR